MQIRETDTYRTIITETTKSFRDCNATSEEEAEDYALESFYIGCASDYDDPDVDYYTIRKYEWCGSGEEWADLAKHLAALGVTSREYELNMDTPDGSTKADLYLSDAEYESVKKFMGYSE